MGAFFWGGLGSGVMRGYQQGQNLQLKRDEAKLRTKMLDAQIKHQDALQRVEDQKQLNLQNLMTGRRNAQAAYEQSVIGGTPGAPQQETEMGDQPVGLQVAGQPGAGQAGRPMNPHELLIHTAIGDTSHALPAEVFKDPNQVDPFTALLIEQKFGPGAAARFGVQGGTPPQSPNQPMLQPASTEPAATPQPQAQSLDPNQIRLSKSPRGFTASLAPERNPLGASSRQFKDYETARKAEGWTSDQILAGWQKIQTGQAANVASATTTAKGEATQQLPAPLGKEKDMARLNPRTGQVEMAPAGISPANLAGGGYRTVEGQVLQSLNALAPAKQALGVFKDQAEQLAKESEGLLGSASNVAGAMPGMLGSIAQRAGASNTGDNLTAATLNFMQHYDRVVGGLRGASSPQLLEIMQARAPKAGMNPTQIRNRAQYIENVFKAMEGELRNTLNGRPVDETAVSRAIMVDPDKRSATPGGAGAALGGGAMPPSSDKDSRLKGLGF